MGRAPCCSKVGLHRGPWTTREDALLIKYIEAHGEGQWRSLPKKAGLLRCGKSCRLRWMNYLRPDIKRGNITPEEDDLIIRLHSLLGNRWSLIAGRLPGRTDNEIKNYWNTHLSKRLRSHGTDPNTHKTLVSPLDLGKHSKRSSKKRQGRNPIHNNNYANKAGKIIQKMNQQVDKKLNSTNEEEKERTKIHLPKPVRVTSIISLTRNNNNNNSNGRFETTTNYNFSTTTTSPSCQSQSQSQNHGRLAFDADNDLILDIPWLSSCNANIIHDDNDFDHLLMMGTCSDNADHDILQNHHHHIKATMPDNKNQQFEKLYEEYLQLIEADDDHRDNDGHPYYNNDDDDDDDGDLAPLDSFTESFLI